MTVTFVDTGFLIATALKNDDLHERAIAWQRSLHGRLLTTEYVVVEFVDALSIPAVRQAAVDTVGVLRRRPTVRIVPASTALMNEGLEFLAHHSDKRWSLTDCISFVIMRREGLLDALSRDHHFEQAGFRALLRMDPPTAR